MFTITMPNSTIATNGPFMIPLDAYAANTTNPLTGLLYADVKVFPAIGTEFFDHTSTASPKSNTYSFISYGTAL